MKPKTIDRVKTGRLSTMLSWACWQGLEVGNIASRESTPVARGSKIWTIYNGTSYGCTKRAPCAGAWHLTP